MLFNNGTKYASLIISGLVPAIVTNFISIVCKNVYRKLTLLESHMYQFYINLR
ncbi:hypothetical protein NARC_150065 [Candidatus Nitrosocosmicus arcticus]|uniref:Uncharacterized protein n=1 Tax=Candidatus Nitrosocosmicus arcticus TaxID=2035267 RepID=A0A557SS87_9ARCH|nr:hypothetical protein NARC_150065 [Candidatus Nitrosocosmicus arcticus]